MRLWRALRPGAGRSRAAPTPTPDGAHASNDAADEQQAARDEPMGTVQVEIPIPAGSTLGIVVEEIFAESYERDDEVIHFRKSRRGAREIDCSLTIRTCRAIGRDRSVGTMTMFSSLKLPSLRSRSKSGGGGGGGGGGGAVGLSGSLGDLREAPAVVGKPPRTPLPPRRRRPSTCGVERGLCPSIGALRPGSAAQRSDAVATGERLAAVNGVRTRGLRRDEVAALLRAARDRATLELQYPLPEPAEGGAGVATRVRQVRLERDAGGSLGFTVRGGAHPDPSLARPLVVTHVRPGGPADREGCVQAGDRLVAADGASLLGATLAEALSLLRRDGPALLTFEYDVSVLAAAVRHAAGPLLVEVALPPGRDLGLALADAAGAGDSVAGAAGGCGRVVVAGVRPASVAERCGALQVGDQILAVGSVRVDGTQGVGVAEVEELLQQAPGSTLALEVLPVSYSSNWRLSDNRSRGYANSKSSPVQPPSPCSSPSGFSTLNLHRRGYSRVKSDNGHEGNSSASSFGGIFHTESLLVILEPDEHGYGLSVRDSPSGEVVVSHVESESPAERSGCIQIGDRILVIGTHSIAAENFSAGNVMHMLQEMGRPGSRLSLQLEFDVADSVVPSSGVFSVKLAKRGSGLGITISASKNRTESDPLLISDIRRGSVAHRTGSLSPGDRLLAINGVLLDQCSLEDTQHILQNSSDIVTLRVQKDDSFSEHPQNQIVVYTVELVRHGGPLGITIAGSEQPFEPITISGLTAGGLAEKTGALHVGDRLLAICGESLQGKPLSEAINLLQNSGDTVTLKIARNSEQSLNAEQQKQTPLDGTIHELSAGQFGPAIPSVDSAVESWDSMMGHASPSNHVSVMELYQAESATVKRRHKGDMSNDPPLNQWDHLSRSSHSIDSGQSGVLSEEDSKINWEKIDVPGIEETNTQINTDSQLTNSAEEQIERNPNSTHISCSLSDSPLPLPHYMQCNGNSLGSKHAKETGSSTGELYNMEGCTSFIHINPPSSPNSSHLELHQVTLFKDPVYEDFGFSVSDGLYERGVFINRIRKGGPADVSGILKPFDRILQVNDTRTHDFDCCLTVPLIASAGEKLELTVARNPYCSSDNNEINNSMPWVDEEESISYSPAGFSSTAAITKTLI